MSMDGYLDGVSEHRLLLSNDADFDAGANFFTLGDADKIVYCSTSAMDKALARFGQSATVVDGGQPVSFQRLAEDLYARGVDRLMVEGGGETHTQFLTEGLVDELQLVVAPIFVGDSQARRFVSDGRFPWNPDRRATLAEVRQIGDVALLRYAMSARFDGSLS